MSFPDLMLPLRAIAFQALFLVVAVAIEATVLEREFGTSRPGSVLYALLINLASTVAGWIAFLALEPLLPDNWRMAAMSFVFFNQVFGNLDVSVVLPVLAFVTFLSTLFLELLTLGLCMKLWSPAGLSPQLSPAEVRYGRAQRYRSSGVARHRRNALLKANGYSYGAILLMLLVLQRASFLN
ncbi:MAG: hypothetical protein HC824_18290 [Synechococcales cyanobacterium RM1_1_8]|nr:hypothetical protein [Synechococcales cyanobacterium RM1_1_8]